MTIITALVTTEQGSAGRRGRAGRRVGATIRHGLMLAAMGPCLLASPPAAHAAALTILLIVAAWTAILARRDEQAVPALADATAMVGAALVALLVDHGAAGLHAAHAVGGAPGGSIAIAGLVSAGWVGLRASTWRSALLAPRAKLHAVWTAIMLAAMLAAPAFHRQLA